MENRVNLAFTIGSLQHLTGSVIILTIEIITGSRDDLIHSKEIWNVEVTYDLVNNYYETSTFLEKVFFFAILCRVTYANHVFLTVNSH